MLTGLGMVNGDKMIRIAPEIDFRASCPKDSANLEMTGAAIPGMRSLAEGTCKVCGSSYYIDLPVSHALRSHAILDRETAEAWSPDYPNWFTKLLRETYLHPHESNVVPVVHKRFDSDRIVILNCLDFLYGHILLKLLNVQRYLDNDAELGCCVLIPSRLAHFVPDGVAEIWEFPCTVKEGGKWYPSLERWIDQEIHRRKECYLSPAYSHPSHRIYDLSRFIPEFPDVTDLLGDADPVILFSYREDRLWGRNLKCQEQNIQETYEELGERFPNLGFVLIGFGLKNLFKERYGRLLDLRVTQASRETDELWLAVMNSSNCAIGTHGSNMLLPSGLARSTVELAPVTRLGNVFSDFLFPHGLSDVRDALLRYRMIYGNAHLSDVSPSIVVDLVHSMVLLNDRQSNWFKMGENQEGDLAPETKQRFDSDWLQFTQTSRERHPRKRRNTGMAKSWKRLLRG